MRIIPLLIFLLLPALATQAVYRVNAWIYENDTIELEELKLMFFGTSDFVLEGDYTLYLLDENEIPLHNVSFFVDFMILTDPPESSDISMIDLFIPYNRDAKYIKINHGEKEIFRQDLSITCNTDGSCGKFESFLSCPEDCTQENDDICIPAENGVCDPQCAEGVDPDCQTSDERTEEDYLDIAKISWWYIIPILLVIIIFFALRKRD